MIFRKNAKKKKCEMLIAKIAKIAKIWVALLPLHDPNSLNNYDPNSLNNTFTTSYLLRVARPCQGKHIEMPQSATVARALHLITESKVIVPFCQCLTLRTVTGRREGGAGRHRAAACWGGGGGGRRGQGRLWGEWRALRCAPRRSWGCRHSAGDSSGIKPRKQWSLPSTDSMWIT